MVNYIEKKKNNVIDLIGICNQKCPFCSGYPTKVYYNKIKEQAIGQKELFIQGGEPTLSKRLIEFIGFSRNNGTKIINLITNGLLLSNKNLSKSLVGKIDYYHFAFNSHRINIADELGGSINTLSQKLKGVLNIISNGEGSKIRLVHIIQTKNINDLILFILFIQKYINKIGVLELKYIRYFGNNYNLQNIPKYTDYSDIINKSLLLCENYNIHFIINGIPLCFINKRFHKNHTDYHNKNHTESNLYSKLNKCEKCEYLEYCPGVRNDYIKINGKKEFL